MLDSFATLVDNHQGAYIDFSRLKLFILDLDKFSGFQIPINNTRRLQDYILEVCATFNISRFVLLTRPSEMFTFLFTSFF
ncbi:hypothetical protein HanPI659440_Chr17g0682501 [Helianthus annuus]|nr:hypothetical protein HanPI659440_Chr17g0682501 [Helianthus annuus]